MKVRVQDSKAPYPLFVIRGKLRLIGLDDNIIDIILRRLFQKKKLTEEELILSIEDAISEHSNRFLEDFRLLAKYEQLREASVEVPPIILVLEGASATGKSLLAMELLHDITATRFVSSDTIRIILRGLFDSNKYPELYCHTYQAYQFKQSGDSSLSNIVRGFIAQSEIIIPYIENLVMKLLEEGANGVVEGVHVLPGLFRKRNEDVLEILVNPERDIHRAMFLNKHSAGMLRTVSTDIKIRESEFNAARLIQDYMLSRALENNIPIIQLDSYEEARSKIQRLVMNHVKELLKRYS